MLLNNFNPFFDIDKTLDEFDRMFGTVGRPIGMRSVPRGTFPPINIYNQGDKAVLVAEVPGIKAEDIELTVLGDAVTLKGQRQGQSEKDELFYRKERPSVAFSRTVSLPDPVDPDSIHATQKNGMLIVEMHKAKEAKSKKIQIKV